MSFQRPRITPAWNRPEARCFSSASSFWLMVVVSSAVHARGRHQVEHDLVFRVMHEGPEMGIRVRPILGAGDLEHQFGCVGRLYPKVLSGPLLNPAHRGRRTERPPDVPPGIADGDLDGLVTMQVDPHSMRDLLDRDEGVLVVHILQKQEVVDLGRTLGELGKAGGTEFRYAGGFPDFDDLDVTEGFRLQKDLLRHGSPVWAARNCSLLLSNPRRRRQKVKGDELFRHVRANSDVGAPPTVLAVTRTPVSGVESLGGGERISHSKIPARAE